MAISSYLDDFYSGSQRQRVLLFPSKKKCKSTEGVWFPSWTFTKVTAWCFHWLQHREAPASDIQYRLDHERRLRLAADEREAVLPQVEKWRLAQCFRAFLGMKNTTTQEPFSRSLSLVPSAAWRRASARGGPARRPGAAGTPQSRRALAAGAGAAAPRVAPLQTQHRHLLHEAQVHPYALEAWPQRQPLRGEPGAPGGEWGRDWSA